MITLSAFVSAAFAKVAWASRILSSLNRCVISRVGSIRLACTVFNSIGVESVSTSRVVIEMFCDQSRSR